MKIESDEDGYKIERLLALLQQSKFPTLDGRLVFQLVSDANWLYSLLEEWRNKNGLQKENKETNEKVKKVKNAVG